MALRNILTIGEPELKKKCRPVTEFNDRIKLLIDDLKDTLTNVTGLGLAAPQVGILRRAAIVFVDETEMLELINPEIVEREGTSNIEEACLSCPGLAGYVERPERIVVKAFTRDGEEYSRELTGINARAVCHEVDHLDGILFVDIAENLRRDDAIDREEPGHETVEEKETTDNRAEGIEL